jgi:hypothetical protein
MDDIDILVPEDRLADTIAVLTAMNLHPQGISARDLIQNRRSHRSNEPGCGFAGPDRNIDLHWKALHLDLRPEADDRFWQAHHKTSLDGMPIRVLDPAHQLIHICAHAAQRFAATAAERWPADAILVIRGSTDLCIERLVSEADKRGLSAIMAEGLGFLAQEFHVPIPNAAISCIRAAASLTERMEMRVLATPKVTRISHYLLTLLNFKCRSRSQSIARVLPDFLKSRTGVGHIMPAVIVSAQIVLGRPSWLRRILGRDRYRILPDTDRLPKVGDTLNFGSPQFEESPLISGWYRLPEPTGRWTYGYEATVAWCVQGQDQDLTLFIDGIPALDQKARFQSIGLWANDRCIASWRIKKDTVSPLPARVLVPRGLIRNRDVLMLTFLIRRPVGMDLRGLYLHALTLKAKENSGRRHC